MYDSGMSVTQRLNSIAQRAMEVEKRLAPTPFSVNNIKKEEQANVTELKGKFAFTKALTDREQKVFDFLLENNGKIVYAKDIADLLELPRDYIYKYIKNLRSKIEGDKLQNADKSGFVLNL
jgi:DNA-binding response OmpR family regulator